MESSNEDSLSLDMAYIVAALIEESGGEVHVSTEWFTSKENPFAGKQLAFTEGGGVIYITLAEGDKE